MKQTASRDRLLSISALVLIALGVCVGWIRAKNGGGDFKVLHLMGTGILTGTNVYKFNGFGDVGQGILGMVYPPATGFSVVPLALLPYPIAKVSFFALSNLAIIVGVRSLVRFVSKDAPSYVWMFTVAAILLSAAIRWGIMLLQGAPLVLGLLCSFLVAFHTNRPRTAYALAVFATAFKMTLSIPFLGLLLLRRRFVAVGVAIGVWVLLNAIGFHRMGPDAFATYQANVRAFESLAVPHNINAPDPWLGAALPRLDWVFLFYGLTKNLAVSRFANLACCGVTALYLAWEGWRTPSPSTVATSARFLVPLACLGSLCVYHHQYDACIFFAPLILFAFGPASLRKPPWAVWLAVPLAFMITLLPIGQVQKLIEITAGEHWVALLKLTFPVAITATLIGSLAMIKYGVDEPGESRSLVDAAEEPRA